MNYFSEENITFLLPGPSGDLEVATSSENADSSSPIAIICHPHPLYGGTMNNKVVTTLGRTFKDLKIRTVRFNFRGVGKSQGKYDEGRGEVDDLLCVIEWVKRVGGNVPLYLAGFSFGSFIAATAATKIPVKQLICVAPPVVNFHMENLPPVLCPWIVIQGEEDEVILPKTVYNWAKKREDSPILIKIPEASHFFHAKLLVLREVLFEALK